MLIGVIELETSRADADDDADGDSGSVAVEEWSEKGSHGVWRECVCVSRYVSGMKYLYIGQSAVCPTAMLLAPVRNEVNSDSGQTRTQTRFIN